MSIVLTEHDALDVSAGSTQARRRVNFGRDVDTQAHAAALLIAGPASGNVGEVSRAITIGADGLLPDAAITVTITVIGGAGTLSAGTRSISQAQPTASVTVTPTAEGLLTVQCSAPGLGTTTHDYDVLPAGTAAPTVPNWLHFANPAQVWEQSHGTVPAGCAYGSGGAANWSNRLSTQFAGIETGSKGFSTWRADGTVTLPTGYDLTATELRKGAVTPTYAIARRVTTAGKAAVEFRIDKAEAAWAAQPLGVLRSELMLTSPQQRTPWDHEMWAICGVRIPTSYLLSESPGGKFYNVIWQLHDGPNGLTGNPPVSFRLVGGNGIAADAYIDTAVRRYNGVNWPTGPLARGNTFQRRWLPIVRAPAADTWHYLICHYRSGCGYTDPTRGEIYGPATEAARRAFVHVYVATDTGDPRLVLRYDGFWGSPYIPGSAQALSENAGAPGLCAWDQYWKGGIYSVSNFAPAAAGNDRTIINRGIKVWRAIDNPRIDVWSVLEDYRA